MWLRLKYAGSIINLDGVYHVETNPEQGSCVLHYASGATIPVSYLDTPQVLRAFDAEIDDYISALNRFDRIKEDDAPAPEDVCRHGYAAILPAEACCGSCERAEGAA